MSLPDASHYAEAFSRFVGQAPAPDRHAVMAPMLYGRVPMSMDAPMDKGDPILVRVDAGRWVAECPDCRGAQLASDTDPRYLCHNCGNASVGGRWRRLAWPKDRAGIEAALKSRLVDNRHWLPGETVAALHAENAEHGLSGLVV